MARSRRGEMYAAVAFVLAAVCVVALGAAPARANTIGKTDLVFIIDASSSMGGEIAAVKSGLSAFANGLSTANIDAQYAVVLFGGAPELVLDFTNDETALTTAFGQISVGGAVSGFQNNHNLNPEAGLEAIRIVLGAATDSTLLRTNVGGTGGLAFRADAQINLILVTDEDSDRPYYAANRYSDQTTEDPPATWPASPTNGWVLEVGDTAQAAIDQEAFVNILMNRNDSPSVHQYGDPNLDVSDPDFSDFDPAATLANLVAANLQGSLEGQLLAAGLVGRTFDINQVSNAGFIDNFFSAKVEEITESIVPEPCVLLTLGMGIASLGGYLRRRRAA